MTDMLERAEVVCTARNHGTVSAYKKERCRHPAAVEAYQAHLAQYRVAYRAGLVRRSVGRGGDPRERWRGPRTRVDSLVVDFLMAGYRFAGQAPTLREYQVAAHRLMAAGYDAVETGLRLGHTDRSVWRWKTEWRDLAERRTERRHADAVWRDRHKHGRR